MKLFAMVCAFGLICLPCFAQEKIETGPGDRLAGIEWLKQFEGTWSTAYNGTMRTRLVANRWIVSEISFRQGVSSVQTIGYDAKRKKFVGTWIDGTSSHIWKYQGELEEDGKALVLEAEGPDMTDSSKTRRYRDKYRFTTKDEIAAESQILNDEGKWHTFSKSKMTRKSGDE